MTGQMRAFMAVVAVSTILTEWFVGSVWAAADNDIRVIIACTAVIWAIKYFVYRFSNPCLISTLPREIVEADKGGGRRVSQTVRRVAMALGVGYVIAFYFEQHNLITVISRIIPGLVLVFGAISPRRFYEIRLFVFFVVTSSIVSMLALLPIIFAMLMYVQIHEVVCGLAGIYLLFQFGREAAQLMPAASRKRLT